MINIRNNLYTITSITFLTCALSLSYGCQLHPTQSRNEIHDTYQISRNSSQINIPLSDDDVIFTREYIYRASDDDSKHSSRRMALEQIKLLLSEEIGTYIESYLEIDSIHTPGVTRNDMKQEILSLSSGITKINIIDEKWDGESYYVKAKVRTNPDQAMSSLLEAIKAKSSKNEIDRLNQIIDEQNNQLKVTEVQLQILQKDLVRQEIINETRKSELIRLKGELVNAIKEQAQQEHELSMHEQQIRDVKKKIAVARRRLEQQKDKACLMVNGMAKQKVIEAIGDPDDTALDDEYYYYGTVTISFSRGLVYKIFGCN